MRLFVAAVLSLIPMFASAQDDYSTVGHTFYVWGEWNPNPSGYNLFLYPDDGSYPQPLQHNSYEYVKTIWNPYPVAVYYAEVEVLSSKTYNIVPQYLNAATNQWTGIGQRYNVSMETDYYYETWK